MGWSKVGGRREQTNDGAPVTTGTETGTLDDRVADAVDGTLDQHAWIERLSSIGWIAKGLVYILMGLAATQIARFDRPEDRASPQGSIARIAQVSTGRVLLALLAAGLFLYAIWRLLSVAVIRGNGLSEWGDRIGYTSSAAFYLLLCSAAVTSAWNDVEPEESSSVETISRSVLEMTLGRWLLGLAGAITVCVGGYFVVHKGVQRSFADRLDGIATPVSDNEPRRAILVVAGVVGWISRGVVTALVGFFLLRTAVMFESDEGDGFDRSLRNVATTGIGTVFVVACAVGLIAYGAFCFLSYRFRAVEDR